MLLEQLQQLEALRKDNAEMAQLVAQLAVLRRDQQQLHELCQQVEVLRSDNLLLLNKSQRLPTLQEEHQQLMVRTTCSLIAITGLQSLQACINLPAWELLVLSVGPLMLGLSLNMSACYLHVFLLATSHQVQDFALPLML